MAAELFFIGVALFGVIFGTGTDLKNKWVPNWINYFLISFGIGGHIVVSILTKSIWPITYSLIGAGIFLGIALAMFYGGAWGGGDAKLLIGLGALLPFVTSANSAPWPFLATLLFNILIIGAIFGIIVTFGLAAKHYQKFKPEIISELEKNKKIVYTAGITLSLPVLFSFINSNFKFLLGIWTLIIILIFIALLTKAVEKTCMFKKIKPSNLIEGDWITHEVKIDDKIQYKPKRYGIERKDIQKLIGLEKDGKLKEIEIKDGIPYVPAFLIALVISLAYGDVMFPIFKAILI